MKALQRFLVALLLATGMILLPAHLFADSLGNTCTSTSSSTQVGTPQPTTGTVRALFIFVKFSDDTFENGCTTQWDHNTYNTTRLPWTNQIVDAAIMQNQTAGSLSDYFDLAS